LDYDILNVKATGWLHDYNVFKNALKDLDVMMSNVISSAWEGVSTVQAGVELLESFSYLAVRKGMKEAVAKKTIELWQMFKEELKQVKSDFDKHKKDPPVPHGWPRYAGAALWAKTLLIRINAVSKCVPHAFKKCHMLIPLFYCMVNRI
jgi:dynein heavy chain